MRLTRVILLIVFGIALIPIPVQAQTSVPHVEVQSILNSMTPQERVGQLFLVTFNGTDANSSSQVHDLIARYHVGGMVLLARNNNFSPDAVTQTHDLIESLQRLEWNTSANPEPDPITGEVAESVYVPLFVGVAQDFSLSWFHFDFSFATDEHR